MTLTRIQHLLTTTVVLLMLAVSPSQSSSSARIDESRDDLIETGRATKLQSPVASPSTIKIVSYNIRWRGGDDMLKLIELFKTDAEIGQATILGLQEVDRNRKRTRNVNTARQMAEALGMYYAWAAPPVVPSKDKKSQEEETGVAILSPYPLTEAKRIVLPNEGPGGRRRVALGATIKIGDKTLRVYSVHAELRMSNEERLEQFKAVLDDVQTNYAKTAHVVVLGDFNTVTGKDVDATTELFTEAKFSTPIKDDLSTWKTFILEFKLDWLWLRGLTATEFGIDKKVRLSDHWPLWAVVKFDEVAAGKKK